MKKYKVHVIWLVIVIIALVGGFSIGKSMATSATGSRSTFALNGSSTRGGFAGARNGAGGGFTSGQVISVDASSITLQLPNGNSENVFYSSSTQVIVPQSASISSVTPGATIMVGGTQNSDGSMTATTIQLRSSGNNGQPK